MRHGKIFVCVDLIEEFAKMKEMGLPTMFINHHDDMENEVGPLSHLNSKAYPPRPSSSVSLSPCRVRRRVMEGRGSLPAHRLREGGAEVEVGMGGATEAGGGMGLRAGGRRTRKNSCILSISHLVRNQSLDSMEKVRQWLL